jgi:hypothetical protein
MGVCLLFLVGVVFAQAPSIKHVAVFETMGAAAGVMDSLSLRYLTDELRKQATQELPSGIYRVMTRDNIFAMLPPDRNSTECFEGQCLVEIGRNVGADYAVKGTVSKFGNMLTLTVEAYETLGANLISSFTVESPDASGLLAAIRKDASEMFAKVQGKTQGQAQSLPPSPPVSAPGQYGLLDIQKPDSSTGWTVYINGAPAQFGVKSLVAGEYQVLLSYERDCFQPLNQMVTVVGGQRSTISAKPVSKMGSLTLSAETQGKPLTEPVWVDGKQVGVTPWSGAVAVCAVVQVGSDRLPVDVVLREGEQVTYMQEVALTGEAAQGVQLGVRAGFGAGWGPGVDFFDDLGGTFQLGVTARFPIGNWRFVPEVLFKYAFDMERESEGFGLYIYELDIPLLFRTSGTFYFMFGPQISFYLATQVHGKYSYENGDYPCENCNVLDFGPVIGFGLAWAHFDIQFRASLNLRGAGGGYYYEYDWSGEGEKISVPSGVDLYLSFLSVAAYF